jgi:hypothetical protein
MSTIGSSMPSTSIVSPKLNNGKTTNLYFNFSPEEAEMQFNEVFTLEYYKKGLVKKDMVIVDIGAAMGLSALYFKDNAKIIYACEPFKDVFDSAVLNTKEYKNIKCFQIGIAGNTRNGLIYGYDNASASTIEVRPNITSQVEVKFMAINEFF